jgi:electron transport complex protein RnfE
MLNIREIFKQGLWQHNPAVVQLLGLCPLLAVTQSATHALGLGIATIFVLFSTNITISCLRHIIPTSVRIPAFVLIIAGYVTLVQEWLAAYFFALYSQLGIFLALITTNCVILGRAEACAYRQTMPHAALDGLAQGCGFAAVLLILGSIRELIAHGTLFADAQQVFGESYAWLTTIIIPNYAGFLLAILPPGAFLLLAAVIALKNKIEQNH